MYIPTYNGCRCPSEQTDIHQAFYYVADAADARILLPMFPVPEFSAMIRWPNHITWHYPWWWKPSPVERVALICRGSRSCLILHLDNPVGLGLNPVEVGGILLGHFSNCGKKYIHWILQSSSWNGTRLATFTVPRQAQDVQYIEHIKLRHGIPRFPGALVAAGHFQRISLMAAAIFFFLLVEI